jgi:RNA polymerase subunit RPABC4/transcription elongation factor Spt4
MTPQELSDIYSFKVCSRCHDIMPDDEELREQMHEECVPCEKDHD